MYDIALTVIVEEQGKLESGFCAEESSRWVIGGGGISGGYMARRDENDWKNDRSIEECRKDGEESRSKFAAGGPRPLKILVASFS